MEIPKRVWEILKIKGHDVWSIEPGASVYDCRSPKLGSYVISTT